MMGSDRPAGTGADPRQGTPHVPPTITPIEHPAS